MGLTAMCRRTLVVLLSFLVVLSAPLGAAGTITQSTYGFGNVRKIVFTATADASDGSFPATAITLKFEGRILAIATNPGATAPTDNYDITLVNQHGHDVLQGVGANRDTSNTEQAPVLYTSTGTHPAVDETDTLTLTIANNAVNSAIVVIEIYYALGG
ncbi:MAG: hypothetical protein AB7I50_00560 [Vicinamibacterales bacterium]